MVLYYGFMINMFFINILLLLVLLLLLLLFYITYNGYFKKTSQ